MTEFLFAILIGCLIAVAILVVSLLRTINILSGDVENLAAENKKLFKENLELKSFVNLYKIH